MSCTLTYYFRSQDRKGVYVQIPRFSVPCKLTLIGLISSLNYRQRELVITSGSNRLSPKDTIRSFMSRMKEWGGVGSPCNQSPVCSLVPFQSLVQHFSGFIRGFCLFSPRSTLPCPEECCIKEDWPGFLLPCPGQE